jgi:hypothetical protein
MLKPLTIVAVMLLVPANARVAAQSNADARPKASTSASGSQR